MFAERLDGSVLLAGCDKSLPGMLMAAARLDLAAVFLYAGSTLPGKLGDRDLTIIDVFEGVGACAAGKITRDELTAIEKATCPGEGACGGMYTANTMASAAEALGMSLPGQCRAAGARPPPGRLRRRLRRGRREHAAQGHHRAADHDQEGVRERDHRRHGARRLDQRRPAPDGDRARGAGRPHARGLQPDRRPHAAPGRRQAVRPVRHDRHRPHRRRARSSCGPCWTPACCTATRSP